MRIAFLCGLISISLFANSSKNNIEKIPYKIAQLEAKHAVHQMHILIKKGLLDEMHKGGLLGGAKFCAFKSEAVLKKLSKDLGEDISIKRVSLRNRNPKSYPLKSEKAIVEALTMIEQSDAYLPKQITQVVGDGVYKIYMPATMSKRTCKKCHGAKNSIKPEVLSFLKEKYPDDKAYGFKAGEVRGAVVVTVKIK
jgi:hypothetical protein